MRRGARAEGYSIAVLLLTSIALCKESPQSAVAIARWRMTKDAREQTRHVRKQLFLPEDDASVVGDRHDGEEGLAERGSRPPGDAEGFYSTVIEGKHVGREGEARNGFGNSRSVQGSRSSTSLQETALSPLNPTGAAPQLSRRQLPGEKKAHKYRLGGGKEDLGECATSRRPKEEERCDGNDVEGHESVISKNVHKHHLSQTVEEIGAHDKDVLMVKQRVQGRTHAANSQRQPECIRQERTIGQGEKGVRAGQNDEESDQRVRERERQGHTIGQVEKKVRQGGDVAESNHYPEVHERPKDRSEKGAAQFARQGKKGRKDADWHEQQQGHERKESDALEVRKKSQSQEEHQRHKHGLENKSSELDSKKPARKSRSRNSDLPPGWGRHVTKTPKHRVYFSTPHNTTQWDPPLGIGAGTEGKMVEGRHLPRKEMATKAESSGSDAEAHVRFDLPAEDTFEGREDGLPTENRDSGTKGDNRRADAFGASERRAQVDQSERVMSRACAPDEEQKHDQREEMENANIWADAVTPGVLKNLMLRDDLKGRRYFEGLCAMGRARWSSLFSFFLCLHAPYLHLAMPTLRTEDTQSRWKFSKCR